MNIYESWERINLCSARFNFSRALALCGRFEWEQLSKREYTIFVIFNEAIRIVFNNFKCWFVINRVKHIFTHMLCIPIMYKRVFKRDLHHSNLEHSWEFPIHLLNTIIQTHNLCINDNWWMYMYFNHAMIIMLWLHISHWTGNYDSLTSGAMVQLKYIP